MDPSDGPCLPKVLHSCVGRAVRGGWIGGQRAGIVTWGNNA